MWRRPVRQRKWHGARSTTGYPGSPRGAALEHERSRAPHKTRIPPTAEGIVQKVISYRQAHPEAGYRRIADELAKGHGWQRMIGPMQVRRILLKAGLDGAVHGGDCLADRRHDLAGLVDQRAQLKAQSVRDGSQQWSVLFQIGA